MHELKKKDTDMKNILYILALIILGTGAVSAQEEVKWYSIEEAIQLASQEPRVLLIDVYTDWCGWCKRMDKDTFSDPKIAADMNKNFYPVKLNAEGKDDIVIGDRTFKFVPSGNRGYHEIAAIVTKGRLSYPTISYVDAQGKVLQAAPGYKPPDQFRVYLEYYSGETYKNQTFQEFSSQFAARETSVIENL
jgi:thioredoxin-related protein